MAGLWVPATLTDLIIQVEKGLHRPPPFDVQSCSQIHKCNLRSLLKNVVSDDLSASHYLNFSLCQISVASCILNYISHICKLSCSKVFPHFGFGQSFWNRLYLTMFGIPVPSGFPCKDQPHSLWPSVVAGLRSVCVAENNGWLSYPLPCTFLG